MHLRARATVLSISFGFRARKEDSCYTSRQRQLPRGWRARSTPAPPPLLPSPLFPPITVPNHDQNHTVWQQSHTRISSRRWRGGAMAKPAGSSVGSSYGLVYELDFHDAEPFRRRGGERAPKGSPVLAISALPTNTVVDVVRALFDHCMEARRGGELMSDHMWTLGERYVSDGGFGLDEFDEVPQSERRSTPLSQVPELQREGAVLRFEYDMGNTSAMTMVVRKLRALDHEESAGEGDWPRKRGASAAAAGGARRAAQANAPASAGWPPSRR